MDTSVLAERRLAVEAGLGFEGDNGCLIHGTWGSWCFIRGGAYHPCLWNRMPLTEGNAATAAPVPGTVPAAALPSGRYDYRVCKSYLTQRKGELTPEEIAILRKTPLVFGCDECQRCCPHNAQAPVTPIPEFKMRRQARLTARELENLTNRQFKEKYGERAFCLAGEETPAAEPGPAGRVINKRQSVRRRNHGNDQTA